MRPQLLQEKLVSKENASIFLSILLHVFFLLIISYQINWIYRYPSSDRQAITVDLVQGVSLDKNFATSKKEVLEITNSSKELEMKSDKNLDAKVDGVSSQPTLTWGWRTVPKIRQQDLNLHNPANELQARMGVEQNQRYSKIQAILNIAKERLSYEQAPTQCALRFDNQLLKANIKCDQPHIEAMVKNFLNPVGINWEEKMNESMKVCIPVETRPTGKDLCN